MCLFVGRLGSTVDPLSEYRPRVHPLNDSSGIATIPWFLTNA